MLETALSAAIARRNTGRPPVWFMRQAGRYHSHYQSLKRYADFITLCKDPAFAAETALGPVHDFNFDAAILFSDLLFPLEVMGMGLRYDPGPKLDFHLQTVADLERLTGGADKGLIGFVGGPFTLYVYAVAGSHEAAAQALPGLTNGLYAGFNDKLLDLLAQNMADQAKGGAECVAVLDTAAGELGSEDFATHVVPVLRTLLEKFRALDPVTAVTYYSRGTGPLHWDKLAGLPIQCLGVDWKHDLVDVLQRYGPSYCIQGNVDPDWLLLPAAELEARLRAVFASVLALPAKLRAGWICGLGHGVLQKTPESNVHLFLKVQRAMFA